MIESFNNLTRDELEQMYLSMSLEGLRTGRGHLSERGNRHVARVVYDRLQEMGSLADRLAPANP